MDLSLRKEIAKQILKKMKEDFGYDIPLSQVMAVIESQSRTIRKHMKDKEKIRLDGLGMFHIKPGREDAVNTFRELNNQGMPVEEIHKVMHEKSSKIRKAKSAARRNKETFSINTFLGKK